MPSLASHTIQDSPIGKPSTKTAAMNKTSGNTALASIVLAPDCLCRIEIDPRQQQQVQALSLSKSEAVAHLDAAVARVNLQLALLVENVVGMMEVWERYAFGGAGGEEDAEEDGDMM
ncbi:hypothetical protein MMC11_006154 [Xylographa trunciseda]|nr:hypothetical protein [Xylographa trunciseda]